MRIHQKDGTHLDVQTEQIDSITFVDTEEQSIGRELKGCWLWGNFEAGYYESLTLNDDKTYVGYVNYITYGVDSTTYGSFSLYSSILTLWSNGFGYQYRYNWYITGLNTNALSVMTKTGPYTYYRLQPEPIRMALGEILSIDDDVSVVFADNIANELVAAGIYAARITVESKGDCIDIQDGKSNDRVFIVLRK